MKSLPETTVLVVSRVRLLRDRLAEMLTARGMTAVATNPRALGRGTAGHVRVAIVDGRDRSAPSTVRLLTADGGDLRILLLGSAEGEEILVECLEAGATGVLDTECDEETLWHALWHVQLDDVVVTRYVLDALLHRHTPMPDGAAPSSRLEQLTSREREVLSLLERGCSNKEIAAQLHITVATVKHHVHRILEKLQVPRRSAAAAQLRGGGPPLR